VLAGIAANRLKIKSFRQNRHAFCGDRQVSAVKLKFNVELKVNREIATKKGATRVQAAPFIILKISIAHYI
jgi:hypothetical protein